MNTIVIKPSEVNKQLEIHFNLWNSKQNNLHFLDVGILLDNINQTLSLKLPSSNDVQINDLSKQVKDIRNSIFNCFVDIVSEQNNYTVLKKQQENSIGNFILSPVQDSVRCGVKNGFITHEFKITKVEKENTNNEDIPFQYIRFRINSFDINKFLIQSPSPSRIFESSYQENSIIDFRVNDYKLLSTKDAQDLQLQKHKFSKIHFLYMTDYLDDICLTSKEYKVRFLEHKIWDPYLGINGERKSDMLVYHICEKDDSNASFMLKFQKNQTSKTHLLFYACVVIYLALIANFIFTFIPIKEINQVTNIRNSIITGISLVIIPFAFWIIRLGLKSIIILLKKIKK